MSRLAIATLENVEAAFEVDPITGSLMLTVDDVRIHVSDVLAALPSSTSREMSAGYFRWEDPVESIALNCHDRERMRLLRIELMESR